jgi:hypothetical protein
MSFDSTATTSTVARRSRDRPSSIDADQPSTSCRSRWSARSEARTYDVDLERARARIGDEEGLDGAPRALSELIYNRCYFSPTKPGVRRRIRNTSRADTRRQAGR